MIETNYPAMTVEEIVALLAGPAGVEIVRVENARRSAEYEAWKVEPVTTHLDHLLPGGPLVVGEWYDVSPGGGYEPGRMWRNCRYLGRRRTREPNYFGDGEYRFFVSYVFERWGAKAATDPYARGSIDTVGIGANGFSVDPITVDPAIAAKAAAKAART